MKEFYIDIQGSFRVKAETWEEAEEKARDMINNYQPVVLDRPYKILDVEEVEE